MKEKIKYDCCPDIELRCEEVQELMGRRIPPLLSYGTGVLLVVTIAFLFSSLYISYPSYITVKAGIVSERESENIGSPSDTIAISVPHDAADWISQQQTIQMRIKDTEKNLKVECLTQSSTSDSLTVLCRLSNPIDSLPLLAAGEFFTASVRTSHKTIFDIFFKEKLSISL